MRKILTIILLMMSTIVSANKVGYSPSYVAYEITDPDGSTDSVSEFVPVSGVLVWKLTKKTRLWSQYSFLDAEIDSSETDIGQDIVSHEIVVNYQKQFALSRSFKPWFGLGLGFNSAEFTSRHTVDQDGFLDQVFEDRDEAFASIHANMSYEWEINNQVSFGLNADISVTNADAFDGFKIGAVLLYDL